VKFADPNLGGLFVRYRSLISLTAVVGVLALAAALSASAFAALPELLGQTNPATFTGNTTAENPTLETTKSETIACKGATEEAVQETNMLGSFHFHFTGCKSSGFNCNTSGDESGVILSLGTFHYVYDTLGEGEALHVAILFLPEEQTIKCTALVTLKVKGSILCLVLEPFRFMTTHEFHCAQSNGKPSETKWWNDEGAEQNALVSTSKNGGAFIESGEQALASFTFSRGVSFAGTEAALPELLGQAANAAYSGKNTVGEPRIENTRGESITCSAYTAEGVQETDLRGSFHIHFAGCSIGSAKCNTAGDESGHVLTLGTFHYVIDHIGTVSELGVAILFLPEEQTIKCSALTTLQITGSVLCLVLEPLASSTTHEFHCTQSGGKPSETTWWNDEGVEEHALLLMSKNGGGSIESGEQASGSFTFDEAVAFMNE
jgi:hypothetical protein